MVQHVETGNAGGTMSLETPIDTGRSRELLFVSPRFLFPVDSGGKIRTTQILRGLKGGRFSVRLLSPATPELVRRHSAELREVCDDFRWWPIRKPGPFGPLARAVHVASSLPIPVRTDWSTDGARLIAQCMAKAPAVTVFDFVHSVVLAPPELSTPAVLFTHNVEAEIFERHARVARNAALRAMWRNQTDKMRRFESAALRRFDVVVAVSERDAQAFRGAYDGVRTVVIPTGVDLDFFRYYEPESGTRVVFCGSMDWLANQEAMGFFLDEIWERIVARVPDAQMTVIGRTPPPALVEKAARRALNWTFTGYVDDVRPHMQGAAVSVIPMRVGGGTRLKVYEAMAAGTPIVSTRVGVEGLPVGDGAHYLCADEPDAFADAVVALLGDRTRRIAMARSAREFVESRFSYVTAARVFEEACIHAVEYHRLRTPCAANSEMEVPT